MTSEDFNAILGQISAGKLAGAELMEPLYVELRAIAARLMTRERASHTLQPTALVHEAFLRLVDAEKVGEQGHLHFLDAAAVTMRRVLIDHARATGAERRGGRENRRRVSLHGIESDEADQVGFDDVDLIALDDALTELAQFQSRHVKIVELRFFAGMSGDQIGSHLGISRSTVVRDLAFARAWLQRRLKSASD